MSSPTIGLWGTWDADRFGDALIARVLEAELARRLPGARIRAQAPLGRLHPTRFDAGAEHAPLGAWSDRRRDELAAALDAVVVSGVPPLASADADLAPLYDAAPGELESLRPSAFLIDGLGPDEADVPVLWLGTWANEENEEGDEGAARVRAARASRPAPELSGLASPLLLVPRLVGPDRVRRRLDQLRATGAYPAAGRPLVVAVGPGLSRRAGRVARAVGAALTADPGRAVVVIGTDRAAGDARAVSAMRAHLPAGAMALSAHAGSEDLVAAIAGAGVLLCGSPAAERVAWGYGIPVLDAAANAEADLAEAIRSALRPATAHEQGLAQSLARLDAGLDEVAKRATQAARRRGARADPAADGPAALVARAHGEQVRRLTVDLTRANERATALAAERDEVTRSVAHLQEAYERVRAQAEVLGAALRGAEARERAAEAAAQAAGAAAQAAAQAEAAAQAAQAGALVALSALEAHASTSLASVAEGSAAALAAVEANAAGVQQSLSAQVAHFAEAVAALSARAEALGAERDLAVSTRDAAVAEATRLRRGVTSLESELAEARAGLAAMVASPAWRALEPARRVGATVRRLRR